MIILTNSEITLLKKTRNSLILAYSITLISYLAMMSFWQYSGFLSTKIEESYNNATTLIGLLLLICLPLLVFILFFVFLAIPRLIKLSKDLKTKEKIIIEGTILGIDKGKNLLDINHQKCFISNNFYSIFKNLVIGDKIALHAAKHSKITVNLQKL